MDILSVLAEVAVPVVERCMDLMVAAVAVGLVAPLLGTVALVFLCKVMMGVWLAEAVLDLLAAVAAVVQTRQAQLEQQAVTVGLVTLI